MTQTLRDDIFCAWQVMKYANNMFEIIASASSDCRTCGNRQQPVPETEAALQRTSENSRTEYYVVESVTFCSFCVLYVFANFLLVDSANDEKGKSERVDNRNGKTVLLIVYLEIASNRIVSEQMTIYIRRVQMTVFRLTLENVS